MNNQPVINIVTLGCSKNLVDSEYLIKQLEENHFTVLHNSNSTEARIAIINTCGFILDAKEESIDTIISFIAAKEKGKLDILYVFGCLTQRYMEELKLEMPEVDEFFGVFETKKIVKSLKAKYISGAKHKRTLTTPSHVAYLKIADGCDRTCAFCAIPQIKGNYRSRRHTDVLEEAKYLASKGVKELILIAQDVTYYGLDQKRKNALHHLLLELATIDQIEWIRLQYMYPHTLTSGLIDIIRDHPKICRYFDIPIQHISDKMLSIMRRGHKKADIIKKLEEIRFKIPGAAIRTSLLVGHPGESQTDFQELLQFVKSFGFDRLGVFRYSHEEGTPSGDTYPDQTGEQEKMKRYNAIMEAQEAIAFDRNRTFINQRLPVIIDRLENGYFIGRTEFDSPEVDGEVFIPSEKYKHLQIGTIHTLKITYVNNYDCYC